MSALQPDREVLEILTAYIDGEASPEEIRFVESLTNDDKIREALDSQRSIKAIVQSQCLRIAAPEHLHSKCLHAIASVGTEDNSRSETQSDIVSSKTPEEVPITPLNRFNWKLFAVTAAAAFVVAFGVRYFGTNQVPVTPDTPIAIYAVEDHVHRHFTTANLISEFESNAHSTSEAEAYLSAHFGMNITVPELEGARFKGVEMSEFVPGYPAPLLKYAATSDDDLIFIFAFSVDEMEGKIHLLRDDEAVKTCRNHDDVHIKDIAGKHVVSWMWGDTWYAGVSDHHGEVLASMLPINR